MNSPAGGFSSLNDVNDGGIAFAAKIWTVTAQGIRANAACLPSFARKFLPAPPTPFVAMKINRSYSVLSAWFALACSVVPAGHAAEPTVSSTATITGRVQDGATGSYLANARLTIVDANRDAFTTQSGEYQIAGLAPGEITLRVYYTGQQPQTVTVRVAAGETAQRDFTLTGVSVAAAAKEGEAIVLDAFTVAAKRAGDAAELAINEQRFAPNIKSVVSTAAFGDIGQDNIGEFLKFMPGVEAEYGDMNINNVRLRGMPTAQTPVSLDGASIVASSPTTTDRNTNFQAMSLNNVSRIEVSKVAMPDSRADSVGGSINLITRSAFDHSRPELRAKLFVQMNSHFPELHKTPGGNNGNDRRDYKWAPNWEINYVNPLSKNFGISINSARNDKWVLVRRLTRSWSTANTDTANPYMSGLALLNYPTFETRNTGGIRFDWKFAPRDVLSFSAHYSRYFSAFEQHNYVYATGSLNRALPDGTRNATTGDFSPTFTQGREGAGSVNQNLVTGYHIQPNAGGNLTYRHTGPVWEWDASFSGNKSKVAYRNTSYGQLWQTRANKTGLTVRFDDITRYGPAAITALRGTTPIDPLTLGDATFAPGPQWTRDAEAQARNLNFNLKRRFSRPSWYGALKTGVSFRSDARDRRFDQYFTPIYVGPDGRAGSGDEVISALPAGTLEDPVFSYYGLPRGYRAPQWVSARNAYSLLRARPEYFTYPVATQVSDYSAWAANMEELQEQVTAGYLMGDVSLWKNRLRLAGGMRYERTANSGRGLLIDNSLQYQKDASGKIIDGNPDQLGVQPISIATDALQIAKLTQIPLGLHATRSYGDWYPSLSATFNASEKALLRFGYARTLARPDFSNLIPTLSVNQVVNPADGASGAGRGTINAKNPNLKPWTADNFDLSAEYYTASGGMFSAGVFRKDITDFFSTTSWLATAEFLDAAGLSDDYLDYQVNYPGNTPGVVRLTGVELAAQQKLRRDLSVFANLSLNRNIGAREADFRGYVRKRINAGFTFTRNRVTLNVNGYHTGKFYNAVSAIAPDGRANRPATTRFDASLDVRLGRRLTLFLWGRNIFNDRDVTLAYGTLTPEYAKFAVESDYGVIFQAGVKTSF